MAGQHTIKAGVQFERLGNDVLTGDAGADRDAELERQLDELPEPVGPWHLRVLRREPHLHESARYTRTTSGLFIQDAWTVNNKLTFNLGLRTEKEDIPSYRPENPGIHFGWADKIAPRVGFAYDLQGRRQVEDVRQLRAVLRHHQAPDAARQLRRRPLDQLLLHARHLRLAEHHLRGRPGRVLQRRPRSSSRSTSVTSRTIRRRARSIPA